MIFSITKASEDAELPGPGAIILVSRARDYIRAYKDRTKALINAFALLPIGIPKPFDPEQESLGWVFNRDIIEKFLSDNPPRDPSENFIALVFGVGPRQVNGTGDPIPGSPNVLHAMMTSATDLGGGKFKLNKLDSAITNDQEFGAEQGNTCCQNALLECMDTLLNTGIVTTQSAVVK